MFTIEKRRIPVGDHMITVRILRPRHLSGHVPGVLWVHGGAYTSGSSKDVLATRARALVTKFGCVLLAPDYRLSGRHPYPAGLQDCYTTLLYMNEHAAELGIRDDQLIVGGESAGGGMTVALCLLARDRGEVNLAFQLPLYPMLDDRPTPSNADNHAPNWNTRKNRRAWKKYLREAWGTDIVSYYAAPARCEDVRGLPPCYTFVGDIEPFYSETVDYVRKLQAAGIRAKVDVYEGWFHAYDLFFPAKRIVREAIGEYEREVQDMLNHCFAPQKSDIGAKDPHFEWGW